MDSRLLIDLAKKATDEEWSAFKICFEATNLQKEFDIQIAVEANNEQVADLIRTQ